MDNTHYVAVAPPVWRRLVNWVVARRRSWRVTIRYDDGMYWLDSDDYPLAAGTSSLAGAIRLAGDLSAWELWGRAKVLIDDDAARADLGAKRS